MPILNNLTVNQIGGAPSGKYQLLQRVTDDSNNEIGTVVGFHLDANNVEYAIVCLDAAYRLATGQITSATGTITDLPSYSNASAYGAKETATFNCDKILAQCTTSGWTSSAVSHCRAQTFTIAGAQYAGQLPTLMEVLKIFEFREAVNTADPTASATPTLVIPTKNTWASTLAVAKNAAWYVAAGGNTSSNGRDNNYFVAPILEIPNANA